MPDDADLQNRFLHRFLDDRQRGVVLGVADYQQLFPGHEPQIAAEYAALTDPPADDHAPTDRIGPWRLHERLGAGSFGLVYRATDARLRRDVALKLLAHGELASDRERERLSREAVIASRLDHPGICTVHEIATHGPWTCIAMRLVPGRTLAATLAAAPGQRLQPATALPLLERTARALHAAHSAGVIHRDVKPGNIMVMPDGSPVVVDFGLARGFGPAATASLDTVGSPGYMAPELIDPTRGEIDARADVWALGVVAWECLAGRRPFAAPTQAALFAAILDRSPEPLALPRDLRTVLTTALAKDPKRRYHSAAAFADDLARVLRGEPVSARPVGRLERTFRWLRRNPLVAALLAAVLASLTIGLLVALSLWQQASRNLRDWERLADGRRLALLQQQADDELLPPTPDKLPAIAAWLASARTLLDRQADHEQALAALRTRALPEAAAARARERLADAALQREIGALAGRASFLQARLAAVDQEVPEAKRERFRRTLGNMLDWTANRQHGLKQLADEPTGHDFADLRDQLQHDQLTELVAGLRRLRGGPGPRTTTIADMEKRQATAATLRQRTIDDHEPAWRDAIARVAANPVYRQFVLLPQLGLIPLGPDPDSRLEEFAAPETGEVPERRDGRLQVGPLTATVFVLLPPGEFAMGAQANDPAAPNHDPQATVWEGPVRRLTVEPFFLAKYEMTQGQWVRLCDDNPSTWSQGMKDGDRVVDLDHPVETIGYRDALTMLARLGWWLPVEARWEYACRAGTSTPWPWPEQDLAACANLADRRYRELQPDGVATVDFDDGHGRHAPVGSYRPNAFGLHDMIGNVAEWCYEQDMPYDPKTTTAAAVPHLVGRQTYLVRGGSFLWGLAFSRSAARASLEGSARHVEVGVRPMRTVQRD